MLACFVPLRVSILAPGCDTTTEVCMFADRTRDVAAVVKHIADVGVAIWCVGTRSGPVKRSLSLTSGDLSCEQGAGESTSVRSLPSVRRLTSDHPGKDDCIPHLSSPVLRRYCTEVGHVDHSLWRECHHRPLGLSRTDRSRLED